LADRRYRKLTLSRLYSTSQTSGWIVRSQPFITPRYGLKLPGPKKKFLVSAANKHHTTSSIAILECNG
jgi:hypothetical protein